MQIHKVFILIILQQFLVI